jgi:hypothetical protein
MDMRGWFTLTDPQRGKTLGAAHALEYTNVPPYSPPEPEDPEDPEEPYSPPDLHDPWNPPPIPPEEWPLREGSSNLWIGSGGGEIETNYTSGSGPADINGNYPSSVAPWAMVTGLSHYDGVHLVNKILHGEKFKAVDSNGSVVADSSGLLCWPRNPGRWSLGNTYIAQYHYGCDMPAEKVSATELAALIVSDGKLYEYLTVPNRAKNTYLLDGGDADIVQVRGDCFLTRNVYKEQKRVHYSRYFNNAQVLDADGKVWNVREDTDAPYQEEYLSSSYLDFDGIPSANYLYRRPVVLSRASAFDIGEDEDPREYNFGGLVYDRRLSSEVIVRIKNRNDYFYSAASLEDKRFVVGFRGYWAIEVE